MLPHPYTDNPQPPIFNGKSQSHYKTGGTRTMTMSNWHTQEEAQACNSTFFG